MAERAPTSARVLPKDHDFIENVGNKLPIPAAGTHPNKFSPMDGPTPHELQTAINSKNNQKGIMGFFNKMLRRPQFTENDAVQFLTASKVKLTEAKKFEEEHLAEAEWARTVNDLYNKGKEIPVEDVNRFVTRRKTAINFRLADLRKDGRKHSLREDEVLLLNEYEELSTASHERLVELTTIYVAELVAKEEANKKRNQK